MACSQTSEKLITLKENKDLEKVSFDLPSLKVVQRFGIFEQDRKSYCETVLGNSTGNFLEQIALEDPDSFSYNQVATYSPKASWCQNELLLQKRNSSQSGCTQSEQPSDIQKGFFVKVSSTQLGDQKENSMYGDLLEKSAVSKPLKKQKEGKSTPFSFYNSGITEFKEFQERMISLHEKYSKMNRQDILYHSKRYFHSLAQREKSFQHANERITEYFDGRKEKLLELLDKI